MSELEVLSTNVINTDKLGKLLMKAVILFYDYPRCFICESNSKFYALLEMSLDEDEFGWNTCEVTLDDINEVNLGQKNIQSLFLNKKSFTIIFSKNSLIGQVSEVQSFEGDNAIEGDLILEDFCDMDEVFDYHNLQKNASLANSPSISFILENSNHCKTGDFLSIINYIRAFSSGLKKPLNLKDSFLSVQKGSTVITFEFKDDNTLLNGDDDFKFAEINNFANFLLADNPEEMFAEVENKKCIEKFDKFLEKTSQQDLLKPKLVVAMPNKQNVKSFGVGKDDKAPKKDLVKKTLDLFKIKTHIEEETITRHGILNGFLIGEKNKFIFKTNNNEIIKGSIDFSMINNDREFSINGSIYKATFKITKFFNEAVEEKRIYKLIELDEICKRTSIEKIDLF